MVSKTHDYFSVKQANVNLDHDTISGEIASIIYQAPDDGFCILRLVTTNNKMMTATGYCAHPKVGQAVVAKGSWVENSQYGKQFKASSITPQLPKSKEAIVHYLSSGAIRGIGKQLAQQLVDHFGTDLLDILSNQPDKLLTLPGIGKKKLAGIRASWETQQGFADASIFLQNHGIGPTRAVHIYKRYGSDTISLVSENPYRLYREISGIGFQIADKMALSLGMSLDNPQRITNGILYIVQESSQQGHTAIERQSLLQDVAALLKLDTETITPQIDAIVHDELLVEINRDDQPLSLVALKHLHEAESAIAKKLGQLCTQPSHLPAYNTIAPMLLKLDEVLGYPLSASQQQALKTIFSHKVCIMTGGPGVGKTTLVQSVVHILQKHFVTFILCAPTGRAAKRLKESTGHNAKTIHRALGVDPVTRKFQHNGQNPLSAEYCIIDEASMLDTTIMQHVLAALPKHCGLLLVGDVDQLPSVGPGNILGDIIQTNRIPVVQLTEIFRQAQSSQIVQYAHTVRKGKMPNFHSNQADSELDCYVTFSEDPAVIQAKIAELVATRIPNKFAVNPMTDIQILCPMHKGALGAQMLNQMMQQCLNPTKTIVKSYGYEYRIGDRVMQTKNNYDKDVFNGDIGYIAGHYQDKQMLSIAFDDKTIDYHYDEMDEVALAYAMTIHKSQGSEFQIVIMPIHAGHYVMLERNLIYTGMTRAKKLLILIGGKQAMLMGIHKQSAKERCTLLHEKIDDIFINN